MRLMRNRRARRVSIPTLIMASAGPETAVTGRAHTRAWLASTLLYRCNCMNDPIDSDRVQPDGEDLNDPAVHVAALRQRIGTVLWESRVGARGSEQWIAFAGDKEPAYSC
jgi:hypothetical protein